MHSNETSLGLLLLGDERRIFGYFERRLSLRSAFHFILKCERSLYKSHLEMVYSKIRDVCDDLFFSILQSKI